MKGEYFLVHIEAALKANDFKKAIDSALQYIKQKQGNFLIYYYMGQDYEGLYQFHHAIESY